MTTTDDAPALHTTDHDDALTTIDPAADVQDRRELDNVGVGLRHVEDVLVNGGEHKVGFLRVVPGGCPGSW